MPLNNVARPTAMPLEAVIQAERRRSHGAIQLAPYSGFTTTSSLSNRVGDGFSKHWPLRPGLSLMIRNLTFREKVVVKRSESQGNPTLGMSFCLKGTIRSRSAHNQKTVQIQSGQASLGILNSAGWTIEYAAKQLILVHLHIRPDAVGLDNQKVINRLPDALRIAMTTRNPTDYFQAHTMTTVMTATVQQLLNCPYRGLPQGLYLESKAIELMSLYFDQILSTQGSEPVSAGMPSGLASRLKEEEVEQICQARDILLDQLANPPKLIELAHQVGLNDRKLKQGFRQVFGTTVFGYLHSYRMQQARQLLLMPRTTIASVAKSIGYANPEAFSVAFRRTYKVSPKAYQMQQR